MPALSPTMTQGNIARWKVQEGDEVRAGDSVAEIETDKATMEIQSTAAGYVAKICVGDGAQNVPVGAIVAVMVEEKEHVGAFASYVPPVVNAAATDAPPAAQSSSSSSTSSSLTSSSTTTVRTDESGGRMWPSVRRLLAESGIDPLAITPTGPRGMLVKGDVLAAMGLCAAPVGSAPSTSTPTLAQNASKKPAASKAAAAPVLDEDTFEDVPVTTIRKVIASRLLESKTQTPHEFVTADVSLASVAKLRAALKAGGVKASVNDCVVYAVARALRASPKVNSAVNSRWKSRRMRWKPSQKVTLQTKASKTSSVKRVRLAQKRDSSRAEMTAMYSPTHRPVME